MDTENPVEIALPEMYRQRRAHEYRVEILAADQSGILHAAVLRIHRREQTRGPEQLQRIDHEIEHDRQQHDEPARAQKPKQIFGWLAHLFEHDLRANASRLSREKPVPTFPDHALEPEIDKFAVLLDSENPESQHHCGRVEKRRPPGPRT